jgi:hypothetical protein
MAVSRNMHTMSIPRNLVPYQLSIILIDHSKILMRKKAMKKLQKEYPPGHKLRHSKRNNLEAFISSTWKTRPEEIA